MQCFTLNIFERFINKWSFGFMQLLHTLRPLNWNGKCELKRKFLIKPNTCIVQIDSKSTVACHRVVCPLSRSGLRSIEVIFCMNFDTRDLGTQTLHTLWVFVLDVSCLYGQKMLGAKFWICNMAKKMVQRKVQARLLIFMNLNLFR